MITPLPQEFEELGQKISDVFSNAELTAERDDFQFYRMVVEELARGELLQLLLAPVLSARTLCYLRYEIAQRTALGDLLFAMQGLGSYPIILAGTEEQKQSYVTRAASGELIAAFAMTEPAAGSDAASMSLSAERRNDSYILNGTKTLISNAGLADFYTLFARTSDGSRGISAFIVDAHSEGLHVTSQQLIGVHPIGQLELHDCIVPASSRLGSEGDGLKIAYSTLDLFRPSVAAAATGMAQRAFDEAIRYAATREQFGKPLAEFQGIQFKIAEMFQLLQASKLLVWDAASRKDAGSTRITLESAAAKSFATEAAQTVVDQALQIHGGIGLIKGSITERLYRDVRALRIYEGATEILKSVIAQQLFKNF